MFLRNSIYPLLRYVALSEHTNGYHDHYHYNLSIIILLLCSYYYHYY